MGSGDAVRAEPEAILKQARSSKGRPAPHAQPVAGGSDLPSLTPKKQHEHRATILAAAIGAAATILAAVLSLDHGIDVGRRNAPVYTTTELDSGFVEFRHLPSGVSFLFPCQYQLVDDALTYGGGEWQLIVNTVPVEEGLIFRVRPIPPKRRNEEFMAWAEVRHGNVLVEDANASMTQPIVGNIRCARFDKRVRNEAGRWFRVAEVWIPFASVAMLEVRWVVAETNTEMEELERQFLGILASLKIRHGPD